MSEIILKPKSWDNLQVQEVHGGFGWKRYGQGGTDTLDNILDDLDSEVGKLKDMIVKMKNVLNCNNEECVDMMKSVDYWTMCPCEKWQLKE